MTRRPVGGDADRGRLHRAQPARRPDRDAARPEAAGAGMSERAPLPAHRARRRDRRAASSLFVLVVALLRAVRRAARSDRADRHRRSPARRAHAWLGTDFLGRDVLSRVLYGGRSVIGLAAAATLLAYLIGLTIGLIAGYSRSLRRPAADAHGRRDAGVPAAALPAGPDHRRRHGLAVLVIGVAAIQAPGISRIVRTATLEVSVRGYVEAAVARGERAFAVIRPRGAARTSSRRCSSTPACGSRTRS